MAKAGLTGRRWRQAQAQIRAATIAYRWNCWLCNEPFDWTLPHNHKRAFTVDHVRARDHGGGMALANLRPAHRSCNSRRGNKPVEPVRSERW